MKPVRIGTRGSKLALIQTNSVASALIEQAKVETDIIVITTEGDRSTKSLSQIGGTGIFANALREALLAGECDVIVHSLKDLPTTPCPGLTLAAIPPRTDARDVLCSRNGHTLDQLPDGAKVGTGSPRRTAQLRAHRKDLNIVDMRGNVDSRLKKVANKELDAVVLAAAGVNRLNLTGIVSEFFDLTDWPTAPGQGALAVEVREGEENRVNILDHTPTRLAVEAERHVLAFLEGGCSAPVGAHAFIDSDLLFLSAQVLSVKATASPPTLLSASHALSLSDTDDPARTVANRVVSELFGAGAATIMSSSTE